MGGEGNYRQQKKVIWTCGILFIFHKITQTKNEKVWG